MYVLCLSTIGFILFTLCFSFRKNKDLTKKLDHKDNYLFNIKNAEFFKDGNCIHIINYNSIYYIKQDTIELNYNKLSYDFIIVNYIYNNTEYKYYIEDSSVKFPMYLNEEIKNYVYINKIMSAKLLISENENGTNENGTNEIDILSMLVPFLGPNYNFYKDLKYIGIKLSMDNILTYLKIKNKEILDKLDLVNKNYKLQLYDNFNNEYNIDSDYLTWNPELKL